MFVVGWGDLGGFYVVLGVVLGGCGFLVLVLCFGLVFVMAGLCACSVFWLFGRTFGRSLVCLFVCLLVCCVGWLPRSFGSLIECSCACVNVWL